MTSQTQIELTCRYRYRYLVDRRKQQLVNLRSYLRKVKLTPKFRHSESSDQQCVDELVDTVNVCSQCNDTRHAKASDTLLQVINKKREYAIEYIAKRQLVNTKNNVLSRIRKRFFNHKKNFQPSRCVPWVRDLPLRPNLNNNTFFGWNVQKENRTHLHDTYVCAFKVLLPDHEVLQEQTYCFRVARTINRLAYCVNAIDRSEYNALNFIFRIYRRQQYDFQSMIDEITSVGFPLPSPDPAVLCDNIISLFARINYFDYNDVTGELGDSYDNALFVFRTELYPFLVAEYLLLRFVLTQPPSSISETIASGLKESFDNDAVVNNVCQTYPGVFTLLYILRLQHSADANGILDLLTDIHASSANPLDCERTTTRLKLLANFICETVYHLERGAISISDSFPKHVLSQLGFFKYSYLVRTQPPEDPAVSLSAMPFLIRD